MQEALQVFFGQQCGSRQSGHILKCMAVRLCYAVGGCS